MNETDICATDRSFLSIVVLIDRKRLIYIERITAENEYTFTDRFYDKQVLHCYSFHETVQRQCRFRIPNSISMRHNITLVLVSGEPTEFLKPWKPAMFAESSVSDLFRKFMKFVKLIAQPIKWLETKECK